VPRLDNHQLAASTQFDSPIVTIANRSFIRVRVDVDETDIGRVAMGQKSYVTAGGVRDLPIGLCVQVFIGEVN
jgi:hypothetical protein